jgi:hypothetical protein
MYEEDNNFFTNICCIHYDIEIFWQLFYVLVVKEQDRYQV